MTFLKQSEFNHFPLVFQRTTMQLDALKISNKSAYPISSVSLGRRFVTPNVQTIYFDKVHKTLQFESLNLFDKDLFKILVVNNVKLEQIFLSKLKHYLLVQFLKPILDIIHTTDRL